MFVHSQAGFGLHVPTVLLKMAFMSGKECTRLVLVDKASTGKSGKKHKNTPPKVLEVSSNVGNGNVIEIVENTADDDRRKYGYEAIEYQISQVLDTVKNLQRLMIEREQTESLLERWDRLCYRLDVIALIAGQAINIAILIAWLGY